MRQPGYFQNIFIRSLPLFDLNVCLCSLHILASLCQSFSQSTPNNVFHPDYRASTERGVHISLASRIVRDVIVCINHAMRRSGSELHTIASNDALGCNKEMTNL